MAMVPPATIESGHFPVKDAAQRNPVMEVGSGQRGPRNGRYQPPVSAPVLRWGRSFHRSHPD
jgi:hypothetical protein